MPESQGQWPNNGQCKCLTMLWPLIKVKREYVDECTVGGGYLQYVNCTCKECGRKWEETFGD